MCIAGWLDRHRNRHSVSHELNMHTPIERLCLRFVCVLEAWMAAAHERGMRAHSHALTQSQCERKTIKWLSSALMISFFPRHLFNIYIAIGAM